MNENGPKIPIPGAAGESIRAALLKVATHPGELDFRLQKQRLPGGGYTYTVSLTQPPAKSA
jgi:hypothetical protein